MDSFVKARRRILDIDFGRADLSGASINLALKNNVMACLQEWQITSLGETRKMTLCSVPLMDMNFCFRTQSKAALCLSALICHDT